MGLCCGDISGAFISGGRGLRRRGPFVHLIRPYPVVSIDDVHVLLYKIYLFIFTLLHVALVCQQTLQQQNCKQAEHSAHLGYMITLTG